MIFFLVLFSWHCKLKVLSMNILMNFLLPSLFMFMSLHPPPPRVIAIYICRAFFKLTLSFVTQGMKKEKGIEK